jgi:hypothetical protein
MQTISADEFKQRYGDQGASQFSQPAQQPQGPSFLDRVKSVARGGVDQIKQGASEVNSNNPVKFVEGALRVGAGAVNTAFSPVSAAIEPAVKPAINYAADKISNIPAVQKFANSKAGQVTGRVVDDVNNLNTIAGAVAGGMEVPKAGVAIKNTASNIHLPELPKPNIGEALSTTKGAVRDVLPSMDRLVNHQVTSALELTQGDVRNIAQSTGHEVGQFLAEKNLIGTNKETTVSNIQNFFKQNYETVRSEIKNVKELYKPSQVPRYVEALKAIQDKVTSVPGLQKVGTEVSNLLGKKEGITLDDVQHVKELMDDHFNIYKATGDVGDNIAKEGLANIRRDLKGFIEKEVKKNTGTDIGELNNNVQAAKGIMDAVESRATRGLTKSNFGPSDYGAFISGTLASGGNPFVGMAALFAKKVMASPTVQLKIAKYLDSISDARKAAIQEDLKAGNIPPEFKQFIKKKK